VSTPKPTDGEARHNANPSRVRLDAFVQRAATSVLGGSRMLDAGSGPAPYKGYFAHTAYESADFQPTEHADGASHHLCTLDEIPVEDARFDMVLCTQVLEHVPEPHAVLSELCRVLRPGGRLWLTAPMFYPEHDEPYDFYRYTTFGLRHRLTAAGFEVEQLEWLEGYFGTLSFQLGTASSALPRRPESYGGGPIGLMCAGLASAARPALGVLSRGMAKLELRHQYTGAGHPKNIAVLARRPLPAP
jgi:SAM-dependent methyltransferase